MRPRAGRWALGGALLALVLLPAPGRRALARDGGPEPALCGRLLEHEGQRVLLLWGSPRERGFAHGYLCADRIVEGLAHDLGKVLAPLLPLYEGVITRLVVPRFAFEADEAEELEGLLEGLRARRGAEGLEVPGLARPVGLTDLQALNTFGDWYGMGCSSLAVWGERTADGEPLVGRNFDFAGLTLPLEGQHVVVHAPRPGRAGWIGVSHAGSIGVVTGLGAGGRYVALHDVRVRTGLAQAARGNAPRLLVLRRLLEAPGEGDFVAAAVRRLGTWPTLYGNNLLVAAPRPPGGGPAAAVLEYDPRLDLEQGVTPRLPEAANLAEYGGLALAADCLLCTNHFRARPPPEPPRRAAEAPEEDAGQGPCWRYGALCAATVGAPEGPWTPAAMFEAMAQAALPRAGAPQRRATDLGRGAAKGTLHQAVAETGLRRLHVRFGRLGAHVTAEPVVVYGLDPWLARAAP